MKKLLITLCIMAVLGLISRGLPTLAQPIQLPHENPDSATKLWDEAGLLLSYSQIINLAQERLSQDALHILNELTHAEIPDNFRYIIGQYSSLYQRFLIAMDKMEYFPTEVIALLDQNQIYAAKQFLDSADIDIQEASFLLKDIEVATSSLSDQLGVFAISGTNRLTQAHTRLDTSLKRLRELIDELRSLQHALNERYIQMTGFTHTELSLAITPASAFVGDSITASGRLSSEGNPVAGGKLFFTLDNESVATATTRFDGSYTANINLPYRYVDTMTLTATYQPSGSYANIYLACRSQPVTINTMFHPTLLEVSAPESAYRGLPFTISGQVIATNGNDNRTLNVFLDDTRLTREIVSGQFRLEITPTEETSLGERNLTVTITPQKRYSGASQSRGIIIAVLPIFADTQTPTIIFPPKSIQVSGRVYHEFGPVTDAPVYLNFKNVATTARTSPNGRFTASLKTPLDMSFIGPQELSINIKPSEPWSAALSTQRQLFVINPVTTVLILAVLTALGLFVRKKSRTPISLSKTAPQVAVTELPAVTPMATPAPKPKLTGIRGQVLSAYQKGLEAVEKITGAIMVPNITLREFLTIATLPSSAATEHFTELTTIAETSLYSNYSPLKDTATRAEQLAAIIREELRRGTP